MYSFILSVIALIVDYLIYGKFVEKVFGPDFNAKTPAQRLSDGVDYVELDWKKSFLIQFLNIAGTDPIFGAVAVAVHDYLIGMMSLKKDGASVTELVGENLGNNATRLMRVFSVVLLVLVGVVFIQSPAAILNDITGINQFVLIAIIIYYLSATVLPVDKIIGKIYPIFGLALLIMAVGIGVGIAV